MLTVNDVYLQPFIWLDVDFTSTLFTLFYIHMFLSISNIKSSSVAELSLNAATNQVLVKYANNAQPYLYSNVDEDVICNVFFSDAIDSIGKWVNTNLKQNSAVTCFTVWL